jgi:hypothetical protein
MSGTGQAYEGWPPRALNRSGDHADVHIMKTAGKVLALAGAIALVAFPATGIAKKGEHGKRGAQTEHAKGGKGKAKSCAKLHSRGFQVGGTLVSMTEDDAATTDASEATVTLLVTSANKHARESGELADQDAAREGVQVKGATYTVPAGDVFELRLGDYGAGAPAPGDSVKVKGRVAVTKKRCAAEDTSAADRYATPDVTRVSVKPAKVEAPEAPETEAPETETPAS